MNETIEVNTLNDGVITTTADQLALAIDSKGFLALVGKLPKNVMDYFDYPHVEYSISAEEYDRIEHILSEAQNK